MEFLTFSDDFWTAFWLWADRISILGFYLVPLSLYVWRNRIRRWWRTNQFISRGDYVDIESQWDGLILLPSNEDVPLKLIEKIAPNMVGVIRTSYGAPYCDTLTAEVRNQGGEIISIDVKDSSVQTIKNTTKVLISQLLEKGVKRLCVDTTGGRSTMSIGMFMAAEELNIETVYLNAQWEDSKVLKSSSQLILISSPELKS